MEKYFNRADTAQIGTIGPGNRDGYRGAPKTVASSALAIGSIVILAGIKELFARRTKELY